MSGEMLTVPVCGGEHKVVQVSIGEAVPVDTGSETCCGDCTLVFTDVPETVLAVVPVIVSETRVVVVPNALVVPGSPLWPGAPPQGPPVTFKA